MAETNPRLRITHAMCWYSSSWPRIRRRRIGATADHTAVAASDGEVALAKDQVAQCDDAVAKLAELKAMLGR